MHSKTVATEPRSAVLRLFGLGALVLLLAGIAPLARGVAAPGEERNFDARIETQLELSVSPSALQVKAAETLRREVPELAVEFDRTTGATRTLYNRMGFLTSSAHGDPMDLALEFVRANLDLLGLSEKDLADYEVTDSVYSKLSGTTHIYLRQTHAGVPLYNGQLHINVSRDGQILSVNNAFLPGLADAVNTTEPGITAADAVQSLAQQLGLPTTVKAAGPGIGDSAGTATRLVASGLSTSPIDAKLMWLPLGAGSARLVWNFQADTPDSQHLYDATVDAVTGQVLTRFDWTNSGSYRVYEQPVESPIHTSPSPPSDARTLAVNPELSSASPSGWFTGGVMSGNNVTACPDASPSNNVCDSNPSCSGTTCDFTINLSSQPSASIPAATANLFYWNNRIHDIQYQYGFDEPGGNFQENNFGNGGSGSDSVNADAQDGGGNCNANFATPTDGGNPRMQMYTCNQASPSRDGDYDSGVIVHEYGHGISIRQVGGPSNSSCLNNSQQAGEGWSDWHALVYTAKSSDTGPQARGVGAYLFNLSANGGTIRDLPYSTSSSVNNWTYSSIAGAAIPHGIGSRWAQGAWEVYWALVDKWGFESDLDNFDISDPNEAGNKRALYYINEGLKNTACSPTFINNRDGIIQAATASFGGADVCTIWEAFAAFGLGTNASTGGSNSTTATNGFNIPAACACTPQPIADAGPNQTITAGQSVTIGTTAQSGHSYSWSPGGQTTAQITVSPTTTTTYTVTATTSCGSATDSVTVTVAGSSGCPAGTTLLHAADFESTADGWTNNGASTCSTGSFVRGTPTSVVNGGVTTQVAGAASGTGAWFTAVNTAAGVDDVDGGTCDTRSPSFSAGAGNLAISFDYFHGQRDAGGDDGFVIDVLNNGSVVATLVNFGGVTNNAAWTPVSTNVNLASAGTVQLRVRATDGPSSGDLVEGGIDNVQICGGEGPPPPACAVDDDFEGGAAAWTNDAASTCSTGAYVVGNPTNPSGGYQVVGSNSGTNSIFTASNSSAGVDDVDGGNCILGSPTWSVGAASTLSVAWWHGQRDQGDDASGDFFRLEYSLNGGSSWTTLRSNGDTTSNPVWATATASIPAGSNVKLRVQCSDGSAAGDLVECGIDDVSICEN
ncbi:MAG: M36 family metallopeptidase [Acidobacteria bacterium]|nr:M36 family metallopeptidase [Acidobacteriota bacterium]